MRGVLLFDWTVPISRRIRGVYELFFFFFRGVYEFFSSDGYELQPVTQIIY
jgi:hypothetical protein